MTELKDKLQQLKRERQARSKSQAIQDAMSELGKDEGLSTRDKLEQLIRLRPDRKPQTPKVKLVYTQHREPLQFTENPHALDARYGSITIGDGLKISSPVLACLSRQPKFEDLDLSTALFFDLETTGLSGGTGTIPFNIGLGYYRDDKFWVGQYFLSEPASESQMIEDFSRFLEDMDFKSIVTFNGKAFDVPLLETRFILHRMPFKLDGLPHLDFLFPARSLWKHKYENCRLAYLARKVLATGRDEDIPSSEVPWRYFQYLQTGNYELIEPVLYHNAEDILSLLGLVILGASIFSEDPNGCSADAMDFVALWTEMTESEDASGDLLYSLRELSMYYEHRAKKFDEAYKFAEEGFVLAMGFSEYYERDFTHRRERLKKKMKATPQGKDKNQEND